MISGEYNLDKEVGRERVKRVKMEERVQRNWIVIFQQTNKKCFLSDNNKEEKEIPGTLGWIKPSSLFV